MTRSTQAGSAGDSPQSSKGAATAGVHGQVTNKGSRSKQFVLLAVALVVSWFSLPVWWPVGVVVWLPVAAYLFVRRRSFGWFAVALSPYVVVTMVSFGSGVSGYFLGTATLRRVGLPSPEFWNLDPELRVYQTTSGCLVNGSELFTHLPNNLAIQILVGMLGPMPGAYAGPYPSREEIKAPLDGAVRLDAQQVKQAGSVSFGAAHVQLSPATRARLIGEGLPSRLGPPLNGERLRAAMVGDAVLLLEGGAWQEGERSVLLVDVATGDVFASYLSSEERPAVSR